MINSSAKVAKATVSGRAKLRPPHPSTVVSTTLDTATTMAKTRALPPWLDPALVRPLPPIAYYEAHLDLTDSDPELDGDVDDSYLAVLESNRDAAARLLARAKASVVRERTHSTAEETVVKAIRCLLRKGLQLERDGLDLRERALKTTEMLLGGLSPEIVALATGSDLTPADATYLETRTALAKRYDALFAKTHAQGSWQESIIPDRLKAAEHTLLDEVRDAQVEGGDLIGEGHVMQALAFDLFANCVGVMVANDPAA